MAEQKVVRNKVVSTLITRDEYDALQTVTRRDGRSMSNYIRWLIYRDLAAVGIDVEALNEGGGMAKDDDDADT